MEFSGKPPPSPLGKGLKEGLIESSKGSGEGVEVVVMISDEGESASKENLNSTKVSSGSVAGSNLVSKSPGTRGLQLKQSKGSNLGLLQVDSPIANVQMSSFMTYPSPEIKIPSPSRDKPPKNLAKIPTGSAFAKPKSRFSEPCPPPVALSKIEKKKSAVALDQAAQQKSPYRQSPNHIKVSAATTPNKTAPITPRTPLLATPAPEEDEDDDVFNSENVPTAKQSCCKKYKFWPSIEWLALVCILGTLIASLTINKLQDLMIWGLSFWKWCLLVLVIICGRLFTEWFINFLVFLIEKNFLLKKKVLYFVYGLKRSVQATIWLALVLLAWVLMFNGAVRRSRSTRRILHYVTRALISCLVGSVIWMLKTLLLKMVAGSFHVATFFDRIQESFFHQYVLQMLSGPPVMEFAENIAGSAQTSKRLSFRSMKKGKEGEKQEVIDVTKLHKLKQEKVSAWTMKGLSNVISNTRLTAIASLDDLDDDDEGEQKDKEITCEWEAKAAAFRIFKNVAKPGSKYIYQDDLMRFLSVEEVTNVLPLFEGGPESGKIKKSALRNWVVRVYQERKSLALSLNDTKTAVKQLNKLVSCIIFVVIVIVWLLVMGIATTEVLVFISSQMLLVVFVFGNTAKVIFEGIIFVFAVHPFDVGDRCVVDGTQMIVEEMNLLTTVFLRYDNQKMYYPNSVLATKCIGNIYRSPFMGDSVEFAIDVSTTAETIGALKSRIKMYIESKPQYWSPNHSVAVLEIENVNKMKMALYVTHTMNHQNMGEKGNRRSELVLEMKKIFQELSIEYHLLPQEVLVSYAGSATTGPTTIGE